MELSRIVLGLRAEPESVGNSLLQLLEVLQNEDIEDRDAVEGYARELSRLVINWMARSDEKSLREVHRQIFAVFTMLGPAHPANHYISDTVWVGTQVRGIALVISTYLRTDNLAKSLGFLAGRRRESWRRALEAMGESRRPVTAGDLVDASLFENVRTAANALTQLSAHGLVQKVEGGGTGIYALSWAGENAAKVLAADVADREFADGDQSDSPSAPVATDTQLENSPPPRVGGSDPFTVMQDTFASASDPPISSEDIPVLVEEVMSQMFHKVLESRLKTRRREVMAGAPARGSFNAPVQSPRAPTARGGKPVIDAIELVGT